MNFFFDNNLPSALARSIRELCRHEPTVGSVVHLTDLFAPAEKDPVWIPQLAAQGGRWYVVSIDKFRKDHRAEREAIRRANHTVYVLDAQWGQHEFWLKAARLVLWWPHVLQHAGLSSGGVYSVPWKRTSQSRFRAI